MPTGPVVGRSPTSALRPFGESLQQAVSCVSHVHVVLVAPRFTLRPEPVVIGWDRALSLTMDVFYEAVPAAVGSRRWRIATTGYRYTLGDSEDREFVSYHWHPRGPSPVTTPHLHLGSRLVRPGLPFAGVHLPSGFVTLADVLRTVIAELGVKPRRGDWEAVLRRCDEEMRSSLSVQQPRPP